MGTGGEAAPLQWGRGGVTLVEHFVSNAKTHQLLILLTFAHKVW